VNSIYLFQNSDQSVPLSSRSRTVPQTYDGRYGTHWQDAVFNTHAGASELMTSSFPLDQNTGTPSDVFLSRVTVGALEDFGYSVDYAAAESYPVLNDGVPASQPTYPTADYLPQVEVFGPALPANFAGVDSGSGFSFSSDPDRNIARRLPPRITYANRSAVILQTTKRQRHTCYSPLHCWEAVMGSSPFLICLPSILPGLPHGQVLRTRPDCGAVKNI
jgi:hypothetical protein